MAQLPPAIIMINAEMSANQIENIKTQLFISESISDTEFNARIAVMPTYPQTVHLQNIRLLVISQSFQDQTNRDYADVVIFIKQGLASILKNNYGPPNVTYTASNINVYDLLRSVNSSYVKIIPRAATPPTAPPIPQLGVGVGGIVGEELRYDQNTIIYVNPDNMYNNTDYINRKP